MSSDDDKNTDERFVIQSKHKAKKERSNNIVQENEDANARSQVPRMFPNISTTIL
jgi:hypothetical protein